MTAQQAGFSSCACCQQVKELQEQIQQLESRLSTVQLALKQAQGKTTSQSQQFTASASLDAMSPSQSLQASQGGGHKKPRSEQTQAMSGQRLPARGAIAAGTPDSGAAAQWGNDHAASPPGAVQRRQGCIMPGTLLQATEGIARNNSTEPQCSCNPDRHAEMALQAMQQQVASLSSKVRKPLVRKQTLKLERPQLQELGKQGLWQEVVDVEEAEVAKQQRLGDYDSPSSTYTSFMLVPLWLPSSC